jgi:hypothetical protein
MSKAILPLFLFAAILMAGAPAAADGWECVSDGKSVCYVSYVRFFPNANPYVRAEIHDPDGVTGCNYVTVRLGEGTSNLLVVRAVQALLTTALTTGMPIRFYRVDGFGTDSNCAANAVQLSAPSH